jgi:hypothetical protein
MSLRTKKIVLVSTNFIAYHYLMLWMMVLHNNKLEK